MRTRLDDLILPEDVVDLVQPQRRHDEVELHGDRAEGQDAAQQRGDGRGHEPLLLRDRSGNLVRPHREGGDISL